MKEHPTPQSDLGKLNLDSAEKLNRIRELIFGQQSRDYEQRIERNRQESTRASQELARLGETLRTLENTFSAQLKSVSESFATQLDEQNKRHAQIVQEMQQRFSQQLQDLQNNHQAQLNALEQAQIQSEAKVLAEMRASAEQLHDQKTDRVKLGSLLIDIGSTLKAHDSAAVVNDLLQELVETIEE